MPIANSTDLCKSIYMNEELFNIFTMAFKDLSSPELLNGLLSNLVNPDINSYLIKSILNNWRVNIPFLNRLCLKIIKSCCYLKNYDKEEIKNINYLIKKGCNIKDIEAVLGTRYEFIYEKPKKSSINKYLLKKMDYLPYTLIEEIERMNSPLIKWIKKK